MASFQIYCGKNSVLIADQKNECQVEGLTEIKYSQDLIKNCLDGVLSGNFVIYSPANELLDEMKKTFKYIEAAGGYVLNSLAQSLVIFRNGFWDLPKGKIEIGESAETAAVREVMEETGLDNAPVIEKKLLDTYHFYRWGDNPEICFKKTYWYLMNYKGHGKTMPQEEEGITKAIWADDGMIDEMIGKTHRNLRILFEFKKDGRI